MGERYDFTDVWTVPTSIEIAWRMVDDEVGMKQAIARGYVPPDLDAVSI